MHFGFLKKINIKNRTAKIVIIAFAALLVCLITGISAKYIIENRGKLTQARALDFYFTVDLLGDTNELSELETDLHLFGGGEKTVSFNVQNYFDTLRINDKDIVYTASLECSDASYSNKATFTSQPADFTMKASGGSQQDEFTVKFPAGYETAGKTVTVTAVIKSSRPYVKEMKINFILHSDDAPLTYRVEDNAGDNFATLIVMANTDVGAGKLHVDWSSINASANVLQIDTTSPYILDGTLSLNSNTPGDSYLKSVTTTRNMAKGESIQIYFFKSDPNANYNIPNTAVNPDAGGNFNITLAK